MLATIEGVLFHTPMLLMVALVLLSYVLVDYKQAMEQLRQAILQLMLRAEKAAAQGEYGVVNGEELMDLVVQKTMVVVVPMLPFYLRPFFTEKVVRKMAEFLYEKALDYLDDGKLNNSFVLDETVAPKPEEVKDETRLPQG